jgi:hypothetical protein
VDLQDRLLLYMFFKTHRVHKYLQRNATNLAKNGLFFYFMKNELYSLICANCPYVTYLFFKFCSILDDKRYTSEMVYNFIAFWLQLSAIFTCDRVLVIKTCTLGRSILFPISAIILYTSSSFTGMQACLPVSRLFCD